MDQHQALASTDVAESRREILLGSYAARSCPLKTEYAFARPGSSLGVAPPPDRDPAPGQVERELERAAHRASVLDHWVAATPGAIDLRSSAEAPAEVREAHTLRALRAGAPLIVGATLPVDRAGHRSGRPPALLRAEGRVPAYHPVVVKWHQILLRDRPDSSAPSTAEPRRVHYGTLAEPEPEAGRELVGFGLRLGSREDDFRQLAHYRRMLEAAGFAPAGEAWGGVIGTDDHPEAPILAWADLAAPLIRTFSRHDPQGWRLRSLLDRYDHEQRFRLNLARHVEGPLEPVVHDECDHCPWWTVCRPRLDEDDLSLRLGRGTLEVLEVLALRRAGVWTVADLAARDLEDLLPEHLARAAHRGDAELRLRTAARRARMLVDHVAFERETVGPIEVPAAEVEVDFDLETAPNGRIYLWGFVVSPGGAPRSLEADTCAGAPQTRQFVRFEDLDQEGETRLAREALGWLQGVMGRAATVRVYHYSGFEVAMLRALAKREQDPLLGWAAERAQEDFVDLLPLVKQHYFGAAGLGLKAVAREAGFSWRDDDPGGLNSQRWFVDAVHDPDEASRARARRRVLHYNEDDVLATRRLRAWLRAQ